MSQQSQTLHLDTLGLYHSLTYLGSGGMAHVYRAVGPKGTVVALKVLRPELGFHETAVKRFHREAETARRLGKHPHIINVYAGLSSQTPVGLLHYLVMEYVDSPSLGVRLQSQGKQPLERVLRYVQHLASALDYAHAQGIFHRDLKPGNVLLADHDQRTILSDFGIAKVQEAYLQLTGNGERLGTPEYMAPEQITRALVSRQTDVYALGLLTYELLTGHQPFRRASAILSWEAVVVHQIPGVRHFEPSLPTSVEHVLHQAMAVEPQQRQRTAGAFFTALQEAVTRPQHRTAAPQAVNRQAAWRVNGAMAQESKPGRAGSEDTIVQLRVSLPGSSQPGGLFAIADGNGNSRMSGEQASRRAAQALCDAVYAPGSATPAERLRQGFQLAHQRVAALADQTGSDQRVFTTLTAALIYDNVLYLSHIGDSRAYLLRNWVLTPLTDDHLSPSNSAQLVRAVGVGREPSIDQPRPLPLAPNDRILLCSDGLSDIVAEEQIGALLARRSPKRAAQALLAATRQHTQDDVSVVVVEIVDSNRRRFRWGSGSEYCSPHNASTSTQSP